MATQSGATVTVHLSAPDTNPDTIADYQPQRLTDRNGPSLEVGELTSNEVSANRQETSIRSGFQQVTGQVGFELSHLAQDRLIELATAEEFVANESMTVGAGTEALSVAAGNDFVYTAATNKLDLAQTGATFSTTFAAGDLVSFDITGGISGNFTGTGVVLAAGLAATTISITVISGGLLAQADISEELFTAVGDVTDAGSPVEGFLAVGDVAAYYEITAPVAAEVGMVGVFQVGNGLGEVHKFVGRIGTKSVAGDTLFVMVEISGSLTAGADQSAASLGGELISRVRKDEMLYSAIRKGYPDAAASGLEQVFSGCTVNNLSMSIQPGSLVTGTADILGISAGALAGPYTAQDSGNPGAATTAYSPFASCVGINDGPNAVVSGLDFTINNNRETVPLLCSPFADNVYEGVANVSGTATLLFENEIEYNRFADEEETSLTVALKSVAGSSDDMMIVHFPRVRYTQPSFEVPANGPVVLTLNFRSLESDYPGTTPVPCSAVIIKTA
jgi:hypothetical protein